MMHHERVLKRRARPPGASLPARAPSQKPPRERGGGKGGGTSPAQKHRAVCADRLALPFKEWRVGWGWDAGWGLPFSPF
jgi:hypothetical protein